MAEQEPEVAVWSVRGDLELALRCVGEDVGLGFGEVGHGGDAGELGERDGGGLID